MRKRTKIVVVVIISESMTKLKDLSFCAPFVRKDDGCETCAVYLVTKIITFVSNRSAEGQYFKFLFPYRFFTHAVRGPCAFTIND